MKVPQADVQETNGAAKTAKEAVPTLWIPTTALGPLLLTEEDAASLLSISKRKLWELAASGAIPFIKIGSLKRFRPADLEEWVSLGCPTK